MIPDYPIKTLNSYHTQNGNFYKLLSDNTWRQLELYLPASPQTYGFSEMDQLADRWLRELNDGDRVAVRWAIGASGKLKSSRFIMTSADKLQSITKSVF